MEFPFLLVFFGVGLMLVGALGDIAKAIKELAYQYRYQNEENRKHASIMKYEKANPSRMVSGTYSTSLISTKQFGEQ